MGASADIEYQDLIAAVNVNSKFLFKPLIVVDDADFILIMGADNLKRLSDFKNAEYIFANFKVMICPRNGIECDMYEDEINEKFKDSGVYGLEVLESIPNIELSSTLIRRDVSEGKLIKYYVPENIEKVIEKEYCI